MYVIQFQTITSITQIIAITGRTNQTVVLRKAPKPFFSFLQMQKILLKNQLNAGRIAKLLVNLK